MIHPIFPLLPQVKTKLKMNLADTHVSICEALLSAVNAVVRVPESTLGSNVKKAAEQLVALQLGGPAIWSTSDNLLYLQALLLMGFANSSSGPIQAQQSSWLNLALSVATTLKLHINHHPIEHLANSDPDTYEKLSRRAWLVLVIMDRWHASGTGASLLIVDYGAKLYPEDNALLGPISHRFTRRYLHPGCLSLLY